VAYHLLVAVTDTQVERGRYDQPLMLGRGVPAKAIRFSVGAWARVDWVLW
jgi:hypothetical protein